MIEFNMKRDVTEIRDKKGNNVIGMWFNNQTISMRYDPVADANFIDVCEKNDSGTYHVVGHINHYVEWVQLCPAFGLYLKVTTTDNLGGDGLCLRRVQTFDFDNVEMENA